MAGKFFCIDFISFLLSLIDTKEQILALVIDKKIYKKILQNEG